MGKLIKVRIDKCSNNMFWYLNQVGKEFNVTDNHFTTGWYRCTFDKYGILKCDCTVIEEPKEESPEPKKFVLPEKWCVKHFDEALEWIQNNAEIGGKRICKSSYYMFPNNELNSNFSYSHPDGYVEITKDQFFKYVLNKNESPERIQFNIEAYNTGKFDVVTRDGESVRIIAIENELKQPVIGIHNGDVNVWGINGNYSPHISNKYKFDLLLTPKTETVWENHYKTTFKTKEEAMFQSTKEDIYDFIETKEIKRPIK